MLPLTIPHLVRGEMLRLAFRTGQRVVELGGVERDLIVLARTEGEVRRC